MYKSQILLTTVFCCLLMAACSPNYNRYSSDSPAVIKKGIKKIAVLTPDITVYELGAGGSQTPIGDQTATAKRNFLDQTKKSLEAKGFSTRVIDTNGADSVTFLEVLAMYKTVNEAIQKKKPTETKKTFDFEIGSMDSLCKVYDTDAFLFLVGWDTEPSSSRQAAAAAGVVIGVLTGVTVTLHEPSLLSVGLVDSRGKIVFYNMDKSVDEWKFSKQKDSDKLTKNLFEDLFSKIK
ncbi:MAG: hypothetical protein L6Q77_07570 [Bacteroidetes bacterium]|nr:hypothetical protein [Bacteroidota bacterium]